MATLTKDEIRKFETGSDIDPNDLPVVAADTIFQGAAVGDNGSGFHRPLVAADPFSGFCEAQVINAGADGDEKVRVVQRGTVELEVVGVAGVGDVGETVYAIDDDTFTLTAGANSPIGKVTRFISGTTVMVYFEAVQSQSL